MVWFDHEDNFYKNLYKRKVAEGRAWYVAMPFACAALARHIYHCLKFQEPYQLEKAFGRVLTSHVENLAKSKIQADLEGTFEVMDAHLSQEEELYPSLRKYYQRFLEFLKHMQRNDFTANASVTDVKGDRSLSPHEEADKDLYLRIVEKQKDGIIVRGAKVHQTGSLSSHELIVLPTRAMGKGDEDYAVAFAVPADTKGVIHVVGRNTLDTREIEGVDCGNSRYSKYCPTVIYDDVFVPWERVFMCGEIEFSGEIVTRFSAFHRQSHGGCKWGKIDVMTGAALAMMDYNGSAKVTHLREKIVDMIYRAETLYGCSLAASYEGKKEPSGTYFINRSWPMPPRFTRAP